MLLTYAERATAANEVVARIEAAGGTATALKADTGEPADIERLFAKADELGTLAALVYNGGITGPPPRSPTRATRRCARCWT